MLRFKTVRHFIAFVCSLSLVFSLFTHVGYATEITGSGSSGDITAELSQDASTFAVTLPSVLPVDMDQDGTITVATNAQKGMRL